MFTVAATPESTPVDLAPIILGRWNEARQLIGRELSEVFSGLDAVPAHRSGIEADRVPCSASFRQILHVEAY